MRSQLRDVSECIEARWHGAEDMVSEVCCRLEIHVFGGLGAGESGVIEDNRTSVGIRKSEAKNQGLEIGLEAGLGCLLER